MIRKGFKRKFLFFLSHIADIYEELSVRSFYRKFYAPMYKPETLTEYLSRMSKVGEIERKIVKGKAVFRISAKGEKMLDEIIPLQKLGEQPWDGLWRIVIFDIEEKRKYVRDRVRAKLRELGFGMWQKSVYISPHSVAEEINEYFQEKDLYPRCICLEAKKTGIEDDIVFAEHVFGLEELTAKYRKLSEEVSIEIEKAKKDDFKSHEISLKLQSFLDKFESIMLNDPFLPKKLFPDYKEREKTQKILTLFTRSIVKSI